MLIYLILSLALAEIVSSDTQHVQENTMQPSAETNAPQYLSIGIFSEYDPDENVLPKGWEPMEFRGLRPTTYRLVGKNGRTVIKAHAEKASSGLIFEKQIDLNEFPVIEWSWMVENFLEKGDLTQKSGDDYPARIYVIFDYDLGNLSWGQRNMIRALRTFYGRVPSRAINYIHGNRAEIGKIVPNPYTDLVTMVVVDSEENPVGEWRSFRRNIYEDYISIYGEEPPPIGGIAIMTDSDDTGETVTAYFGDIRFLKE